MNIAELQNWHGLWEMGYDPDQVHDVINRMSVAEVKEFQLYSGVIPDGLVGPNTLATWRTLALRRSSICDRYIKMYCPKLSMEIPCLSSLLGLET